MILWSSEATPGLEVGKGAERDGLPRLDVRVKRHTNPNETTHQYTGGNSCRDGGKAETKDDVQKEPERRQISVEELKQRKERAETFSKHCKSKKCIYDEKAEDWICDRGTNLQPTKPLSILILALIVHSTLRLLF
jgi:hypothetical protein